MSESLIYVEVNLDKTENFQNSNITGAMLVS